MATATSLPLHRPTDLDAAFVRAIVTLEHAALAPVVSGGVRAWCTVAADALSRVRSVWSTHQAWRSGLLLDFPPHDPESRDRVATLSQRARRQQAELAALEKQVVAIHTALQTDISEDAFPHVWRLRDPLVSWCIAVTVLDDDFEVWFAESTLGARRVG
jgi:hypothetical protein